MKAIPGRPRIGDMVRCKISGLEGIVVARTLFLNGCVQLSVGGKASDGRLPIEGDPAIDEQSLEVLKRNPLKLKIPESELEIDDDDVNEETGGPTRFIKRRNY